MLQSNECPKDECGIATNVQARMPKGRMLQSNECGIATNVFDGIKTTQFPQRSSNNEVPTTLGLKTSIHCVTEVQMKCVSCILN